MYNELMRQLTDSKRVVFLGESGAGNSHAVRVLLSSIGLEEKVIIEEEATAAFIKRNFKINNDIRIESYTDVLDVPEIIMALPESASFIANVHVPFILPTNRGVSFFDLFKHYLLETNDYKGEQHLYQLLKGQLDLVVHFSKTIPILTFYEFSQTPGLLTPK
jgi:hypothetical protein